MKVRQDAWTDEDDLLLAETVLRHVREGSTQLNAFEEVGDKLDRTSAACGFRWNAVVRHRYEKALQLAKKQRKQRQRILGKDVSGKKKLLYSPPVPSIEEFEVPQPAGMMEMSTELNETDSLQLFNTLNTLEMQDTFGLQSLQNLQESLLLQDSDSNTELESESAREAVSQTSDSAEVISEPTETGPTKVEKPEMPLVATDIPKIETESLPQKTAFKPEPEMLAKSAPVIQQTRQANSLTLGHVIAYLQNLNSTNFHADIYKSENERLMREILGLRKENEGLKAQVKKLENNTQTMQEDYETLMQIMNRARKLVLFEEEDHSSTKFKMDRNGNLEKVAE